MPPSKQTYEYFREHTNYRPPAFCVYTIRSSKTLVTDLNKGSSQFIERKRWVGALGLLDLARKNGQSLPIVFAHGECIDGVRYSAVIDALDVSSADESGNGTTVVHISGLRRLRKKQALSTLRLKSTEQPLSDDFIRPYAICYTQEYLPKAPSR